MWSKCINENRRARDWKELQLPEELSGETYKRYNQHCNTPRNISNWQNFWREKNLFYRAKLVSWTKNYLYANIKCARMICVDFITSDVIIHNDRRTASNIRMSAINPCNITVITNKPTRYVIDNNKQYSFQHLLHNRLVRAIRRSEMKRLTPRAPRTRKSFLPGKNARSRKTNMILCVIAFCNNVQRKNEKIMHSIF